MAACGRRTTPGGRGRRFLTSSLRRRWERSRWWLPTRILFTFRAAKDWRGRTSRLATEFINRPTREKLGRTLRDFATVRAYRRLLSIRAIRIAFLRRRWGIRTDRTRSAGFICRRTADKI